MVSGMLHKTAVGEHSLLVSGYILFLSTFHIVPQLWNRCATSSTHNKHAECITSLWKHSQSPCLRNLKLFMYISGRQSSSSSLLLLAHCCISWHMNTIGSVEYETISRPVHHRDPLLKSFPHTTTSGEDLQRVPRLSNLKQRGEQSVWLGQRTQMKSCKKARHFLCMSVKSFSENHSIKHMTKAFEWQVILRSAAHTFTNGRKA